MTFRARALLTTALLSLLAPAQAEDVARFTLTSPVIITSPTGGTGGGEGPPPVLPNSPLFLGVQGSFPEVVDVGDSLSDILLTISGGVAPYNAAFDGTAPGGLSIDATKISGTFMAAGDFNFRIMATDSDGTAPVYSGYHHVEVGNPLSVADYASTLVQATVGQAVNIPLPALTGGKAPYTYVLVGEGGDLGSDGAISFTPQATGSIGPLSVAVSDNAVPPREDATNGVTINVSAPLELTYGGPYSFRNGQSFTVPAPTIVGGRGQPTLSRDMGTFPGTATLQADGSIQVVPTATCASCAISVRAEDADQREDTAEIAFTIKAPLTLTLPPPSSGNVHSFTINQSKSIEPFYSGLDNSGAGTRVYSLQNAPSGMQINQANGVISWTPTASVSDTTVTVRVTDTDGAQASGTFVVAASGYPDGYDIVASRSDSGSTTTWTYSTTVFINRFQPYVQMFSSTGRCEFMYQLYNGAVQVEGGILNLSCPTTSGTAKWLGSPIDLATPLTGTSFRIVTTQRIGSAKAYSPFLGTSKGMR